mmetsp:Transcript_9673/g.12248  ORF Transcript_9673/g.12248 Transcript_9673/m.12248 type:complete len:516 (-) Transcript_9673:319-1866(-)
MIRARSQRPSTKTINTLKQRKNKGRIKTKSSAFILFLTSLALAILMIWSWTALSVIRLGKTEVNKSGNGNKQGSKFGEINNNSQRLDRPKELTVQHDNSGSAPVSISAADSTDQIVESLVKLARMPVNELRTMLDNFDDNNDVDIIKNDPFQLSILQKGQCPWNKKEQSNSNNIVIEWLPKRMLSQTSEWFKSRTSIAHKSRYNHEHRPVAVYYEHLSKAGGTSFCKLAQTNMPKVEVPSYYCMPSSAASPDARVGSWTKSKLTKYFKSKLHRLVSNEWEPFNLDFLSLQPTSEEELKTAFSEEDVMLMFVTSIRNPINRLLSAYKFWGILHNEEEVHPTLEQFTQRHARRASRWKIMSPDFSGNVARFNFATWKFSQGALPVTKIEMDAEQYLSKEALSSGGASRFLLSEAEEDESVWRQPFEQAIRTLARFDLVIPMELLSDYPKPLTDLLGWEKFEKSHVVPSGQVVNNNASSELSNEEYEALWNGNSLDMILYYWTRAVYLTRLHCASILN